MIYGKAREGAGYLLTFWLGVPVAILFVVFMVGSFATIFGAFGIVIMVTAWLVAGTFFTHLYYLMLAKSILAPLE